MTIVTQETVDSLQRSLLLILHRSTLVAERLVGCRYLAMYHTLLSEGLSSRGEPAPALESLRAALDLAYADLCRWMVGCDDQLRVRVSKSDFVCENLFRRKGKL